MTGQWKKALAELEGYVSENPEIKISRQVTIMPEEKREGFYRLFDRAELAFLIEKTPVVFEEAGRLSKAYLAESGELKKNLKLAEIKTTSKLNWLLSDPGKGLSRVLFDPLFDLLRGSKALDEFEREVQEVVVAYWQPLYRRGYEYWTVLSLANMLSPERVLAPSWDEIKHQCHELQPDEKRGWTEEFAPEPEELETIELGHEGYDPAFMISDIILRSQKLGKYVSFGLNLVDAAWYAKNASDRREWVKLRNRGIESRPLLNWPGFVVYTDNEPSEISIVADFCRFLRPEIMVECMEQEHWYQQGYLDRIKTRHEFFKPRLGTFIVSKYPVPDEVFQKLELEKAVLEPAGVKADLKPGAEETTTDTMDGGNMVSVEGGTAEIGMKKSNSNICIIPAAGYNRQSLTPIIEALAPEAIDSAEGSK